LEYTRLGSTGLEVSRICLGCMSFGEPDRGAHPWSLGEDAATPIIRQALEAGINFFDTANVYSNGSSEEIVGKVLGRHAQRDEIVLATKVNGRMRPGPNGAGLSRKAILSEIDHSLRRLGVDYVDLYQIHRFDHSTPVEETLEALNDVVRSGKARYVGASSMYAWEFAKMLHAADRKGWARFVTMQDHYNLVYREEEREMLPLCADRSVGLIPWSPLARGLLARGPGAGATARATTDEYARLLYGAELSAADRAVIAAVHAVAAVRGAAPAQVSLAWLRGRRGVVAPIIGASKPHHLEDAAKSLALNLTPQEVASLEAPYVPHGVSGHQ